MTQSWVSTRCDSYPNPNENHRNPGEQDNSHPRKDRPTFLPITLWNGAASSTTVLGSEELSAP